MRVALCLHGLVGTDDKYGSGDNIINYKVGLQHFKKHVFKKNESVDTFFHTWSHNLSDKLNEVYKPVLSEAEPQPHYSDNLRSQAINCRWKSAQECMKLVELSGNEYDFILLTRFDIAFLVDFEFSKYNSNKFYVQGPPGPISNGINMINDLWFFSNQSNMKKFCNLYDVLKKDDYQKHIDSNHELARKHLLSIGLNDEVEYIFRRGWSGAQDKLNTDTPLVRWYYKNKV
tara:strand:+ start:6776 stop:7465 length:690 start_codon:yes stop_codon:yes gene_type:complete